MLTRLRVPLVIAFLSLAVLALAFTAATTLSAPIWFRYRSTAGLGTLRSAMQILAMLTVAALFVSAALLAIPTALRPAGRWRKLLYVLPAYLLAFTLFGVLLYVLN